MNTNFNIENFAPIIENMSSNDVIKNHQTAVNLNNQMQTKNIAVQNQNQGVTNFKNIFGLTNDDTCPKITHSNFKKGLLINNTKDKFPYNSPQNLLINTNIEECAKRTYNFGKNYFAVTSADPSQSNVNCAVLDDDTLKKIEKEDPKNKFVLWSKCTGERPCNTTSFWFAPTGQIVLRKTNPKTLQRKVVYRIPCNRFDNNTCNPLKGNQQINILSATYGANCKKCDKPVDVNNVKCLIQQDIDKQEAKHPEGGVIQYQVDYNVFDSYLKNKKKLFKPENCHGGPPILNIVATCNGSNLVQAKAAGAPQTMKGGDNATINRNMDENISLPTNQNTSSHGKILNFKCAKGDDCRGAPFTLRLQDNGELQIMPVNSSTPFWSSASKTNKTPSKIIPPHIVDALKHQKIKICKPKDGKQAVHNKITSASVITNGTYILSPSEICYALFKDNKIHVVCALAKTVPISGGNSKGFQVGISDPEETSIAVYGLDQTQDTKNLGQVGHNTGSNVNNYPDSMLSSVCSNPNYMDCWITLKDHVIMSTTDAKQLPSYMKGLQDGKPNLSCNFQNKLLPGILKHSDLVKNGDSLKPAVFDLASCSLEDVMKLASKAPLCHILSLNKHEGTKGKVYALNKDKSSYNSNFTPQHIFNTNSNLPKYPTLLFRQHSNGNTIFVKKPTITSKTCGSKPINPTTVGAYNKLKQCSEMSPNMQCGNNDALKKQACLNNQANKNLNCANKALDKAANDAACKNNALNAQKNALDHSVAQKKQQLQDLHNQMKKAGMKPTTTKCNKHNVSQNPNSSSSSNDPTMHGTNAPVKCPPGSKLGGAGGDGDGKKINKSLDQTLQSYLNDLDVALNQRYLFFGIYSLIGLIVLFILFRLYRRR